MGIRAWFDNDGLNNLKEYLNNTDINNPDSDDDGYSDGEEVRAGTDPNNSSDKPAKDRTSDEDTGLFGLDKIAGIDVILLTLVIIIILILILLLARRRESEAREAGGAE